MNLPADLQQSIDETRAVVRFRFPWWLRPFVMRGVAGLTLGRRIFLRGDPSDVRALLRHELVHVRQIQRLGVLRFYATYVRDYIRNRRRGMPPAEAYRRIPLEIQAFAAEEEESV